MEARNWIARNSKDAVVLLPSVAGHSCPVLLPAVNGGLPENR